MRFKTKPFLSATSLHGYRQIVGQEAMDVLTKELNLSFVLVDDDGAIHALNSENQYLEGYRLYEKREPIIMEAASHPTGDSDLSQGQML